jgi:hypothetical protein
LLAVGIDAEPLVPDVLPGVTLAFESTNLVGDAPVVPLVPVAVSLDGARSTQPLMVTSFLDGEVDDCAAATATAHAAAANVEKTIDRCMCTSFEN